VRSEHRRRSSHKEIIVETPRDQTGPHVGYALGRLPSDSPLGRTRTETKFFADTSSGTDYGLLTTSFGVKVRLDSPPRESGDPFEDPQRSGNTTLLERASIKLGGLSAGYMPSFFDFTPSLSLTTAYASEQNTALIAYTRRIATVDLTVSLEDGTPRQVTGAAWGEYGGQRAPEMVASARQGFDWGNVQVAAVAHPIRAVAAAECCASIYGDGLGWAAMAGVEAFFEVGETSGEFLLNAAWSRGGLDYLNVTNYPADFALSADGRVFLTDGRALVASYAHWWTKQVRMVATFSPFQTSLQTDIFSSRTQGVLLQGALEYVPVRRFVAGLEVNYHHDRVRGGDLGLLRPEAENSYLSWVLYVRRRF
jgi:hypothetical protein